MSFNDRSNHAANKTKKEVAAISSPTPGQVLQGLYDESSETSGAFFETPTHAGNGAPSQSILNALSQQAEVQDTVRAGNHRHPPAKHSSSDSSGLAVSNDALADLFVPPPAALSSNQTQTNNQVGAIDFRAALLAEQQQQEEILRERQRRFDERYRPQTTSRPATPVNSSPATSPALSSRNSSPPPVPILTPPINTPKPPSPAPSPFRPNPLAPSNRGSSVPIKSAGAATHTHQRTVSWSLDKIEATDAASNQSSPHPLPPLPPTPPRSVSPGNRPRILSEDNARLSQRLDLKDVLGMKPFESEAETNILRAVDEFGLRNQQNAGKPDEPSEPSPFFSNLPADFVLPPDEEFSQEPGKAKGHYKSISALSTDSHGTTPRQQQLPVKQPVVNKSLKKEKHPPRHRRVRTKGHRHTMTVEERLFGLTTQLSKLDTDALKHLKDDDEDDVDLLMEAWGQQHQRHQEDKGSKPQNNQKSHRRLVSSAERLAEKAQTLVSNAMRTSQSSLTSAASHLRPVSPVTDIETPADNQRPTVEGHLNVSNQRKNDTDDATSKGSGAVSSPSSPKSRHSSAIEEGDVESDSEDDENSDREEESAEEQDGTTGRRKAKKKRISKPYASFHPKEYLAANIRDDLETFSNFLNPRKKSIWSYCKTVLCFVLLPSTTVAAILFYCVGNPTVAEATESVEGEVADNPASYSWLVLFLGVRQVLTLSLAMATQSFVIDYVALGSRFSLRMLGPVLTLLLVQSKGWPFILTFWAIYDFALLAGSSNFVKHWAYWQDVIDMCNANNPSGQVTDSDWYRKLLGFAIGVGLAVAIKRLVVGLFLSRNTFRHYGEELASVMRGMVLVGEIATLSRFPPPSDEFAQQDVKWREALPIYDEEASQSTAARVPINNVLEFPDLRMLNGSANAETAEGTAPKLEPPSGTVKSEYTRSEQQLIIDLLERWEDPELANRELDRKVPLSAVLHFRRALTLLKRRYPFSPAFGPSDTREATIDSAQNVFERLLKRGSDQDDFLNFDVLAVLATDEEEIDEDKLKELIKLFRPDRDGRLSRLAFVRSIDSLYKRMKLLSANIHNSSQIDIAVENLLNWAFYFILSFIILALLDLNPFQVFLSLSSFILAFSFMFSTASGKYFEGVLLILVQRPFGVGDRIHVANSEADSSPDGSAGWIVEQVNLFSTCVCYGTTNERATVSNGTLASSRIINAARSPNAVVYVNLKFGIDVPYEKIQIFQSAVEAHVKARPREWLAFAGFRAGGISVDRGFIEYKVVAQHREAWQSVVSILESKARLTTYCLEVAKQLDMRYISPPLPVDLKVYNTMERQLPAEFQGNPIDSRTKIA